MNGTTTTPTPLPGWGALTLSFFLPGLGQFVCGSRKTGIAWACSFVLALIGCTWVLASPRFHGLSPMIVSVALLGLLWVAMLADAYFCGSTLPEAHPKRAWIAALLSSLCPGLGQFSNGQFVTGILFLGAKAGAMWLPTIPAYIVGLLLGIASTIQAFRFAQRKFHASEDRMRLLIVGIVLGLFVPSFVALSIRTFWVEPFRMPTLSMQPTLRGLGVDEKGQRRLGDHLFVDKLSYRFSPPKRGDIIVFRTTGIQGLDQGKFYVKRVGGLPGERVSIKPPHLYVNGEKVIEPMIFTTISGQQNGYHGFQLVRSAFQFQEVLSKAEDFIQLGPDQYFVLGDNQPSSLDGRYWGALPRKNIVGKVTKIYWPPDRMGIVVE